VLEGTMRAGGGIAIDDELGTGVPGLFAAGDVTSREKLVGGGPASAWAFATGTFAGRSAADFSKSVGPFAAKRLVTPVGQNGIEPRNRSRVSVEEIIHAAREEMLPLQKNYWRTGVGMTQSLERFDDLWRDAVPALGATKKSTKKETARSRLRTREATALLATARWIYLSAAERKESRGLHRRKDFPDLDTAQDAEHVITGGLDNLWVGRKPHSKTLSLAQGALA
jgi:succinate dehydrogenase/fumarate reductase flavoprotein subunit